MDPDGERELAKGLREGSADAWQALYDALALRIWSSVSRRVGPCPSDVADIVQETFLAAARSARSYDESRGSLWCWLSGIARNQAALFFRKQRFRQQDWPDSAAGSTGPELIPSREPEPAELLEGQELAACVRLVLGKLPSDYETLLLGKYADDLSLEDLAKAEGLTSAAVSSKLARAREAFRSEFQKLQIKKTSSEASR